MFLNQKAKKTGSQTETMIMWWFQGFWDIGGDGFEFKLQGLTV